MSTPICRCRVLYLGSAVPHITKDGLQGIQEPLRELYPDEGVVATRGIDSWLSVWSNGLLLENVDEHGKRLTRFFPVDSLHYCAAVRHVGVPGGATGEERVARFLPLDSPFARVPNAAHPPLFACILRRTTGIKVLECHAFVCKKEMAANALVRCCFHAYADNMYAKQLENGYMPSSSSTTLATTNGHYTANDDVSIYNNDDTNHKIWTGTPNSTTSNNHSNGTTPNGTTTTTTTTAAINDTNERESPLYSSLRSDGTNKSKDGPAPQPRNRPRQMVNASSKLPPPPPTSPQEEEEESNLVLITNGHHHHHQRHSNNGTPKKGPKNNKGKMNGKKGGSMTPRGHVYHLPPPHMLVAGRPLPPFIMARSAEEPTYMPSTRPISPVASYQPMAFPYDRYLMHQHMGSQPRPNKSGKKHQQQQQQQLQQQQQQQQQHHHHHHRNQQQHRNGHSKGHQHNGTLPLPEPERSLVKDDSGEAGKFSTGIYRKKGHLNERAFSYSIRQEHRSRSHSSLATLAFNGHQGSPVPATTNGVHEKEPNGHLAHMVSEISLSEDETDDETAAAPTPASGSGSR